MCLKRSGPKTADKNKEFINKSKLDELSRKTTGSDGSGNRTSDAAEEQKSPGDEDRRPTRAGQRVTRERLETKN